LYFIVACLINRTILDITKNDIKIYTTPCPISLQRKRSYRTADIEQLFVYEHADEVNPHLEEIFYTARYSYQVWVSRKRGEMKMLLDISAVTREWEDSRTLAKQIEERIEAFLKIENIPVLFNQEHPSPTYLALLEALCCIVTEHGTVSRSERGKIVQILKSVSAPMSPADVESHINGFALKVDALGFQRVLDDTARQMTESCSGNIRSRSKFIQALDAVADAAGQTDEEGIAINKLHHTLNAIPLSGPPNDGMTTYEQAVMRQRQQSLHNW